MGDGNGHGGDEPFVPPSNHGADGRFVVGNTLGRPRVMTPQVCEKILSMLEAGNFLRTSCAAAGIGAHTFYYWRDRLRKGDPRAANYAPFYDGVKKAIAVGETSHVSRIEAAAEAGTWQASAWLLERRFPERWAKRDVLEVRGAKDLSDLSDADLAKIQRRAKRSKRG
jgi:transposase